MITKLKRHLKKLSRNNIRVYIFCYNFLCYRETIKDYQWAWLTVLLFCL